MRSNRAIKIAVAYGLDSLVGDPEWYPHPVRVMGGAADALRRLARERLHGSRSLELAGAVIVALVCGSACIAARLLAKLPVGFASETLLLYTCVARKDLKRCSLAIADALETGDLESARRGLPSLVGRDVEELDEHGIARAAVESIGENFTDGVLAPLMWAALGGAPAALAYKGVSTLDSVIGHRDEEYLHIGGCAARLDDLANFVPARASIPLIGLASLLCGLDAPGAVRVGLKDRLKHESPNSAHGEAAFAGALGLKLGGGSTYGGVPRDMPQIGNGTTSADAAHVRKAVRLLDTCSALALLLSVLLSGRRES